MKKTIRFVGLDVHKDTLVIAVADQGRDGEVRAYGTSSSDWHAMERALTKLRADGAELHLAYEAGGFNPSAAAHCARRSGSLGDQARGCFGQGLDRRALRAFVVPTDSALAACLAVAKAGAASLRPDGPHGLGALRRLTALRGGGLQRDVRFLAQIRRPPPGQQLHPPARRR